MHIAQVFNGIVPPQGYGGIERVVYWLIQEFIRQGHQITLIAHRQSQLFKEFPQIQFIDFENAHLVSEQQLGQIDIFHFHNEVIPQWAQHYPYIVTEHGNNKRKMSYQRNTVFLSQSHAKNHNAEYYLSNGIPLGQYPLEKIKQSQLAFMAKLNWRTKNARTAINLSFDTNTPIHLTGGYLKQSRKVWGQWCLKYPFKKHLLHEHGIVDGMEKLQILKSAMCLFYIVNWHEPFALAPHEALACGTPVIASPNGALKEYIQHGENGYLVHSYSEALDAVVMLKSMSDSEREQMAERCRLSAYTIEDSVQQHIAMYEKVLEQRFLYTHEEAKAIKFTNPAAVKINKNFFF